MTTLSFQDVQKLYAFALTNAPLKLALDEKYIQLTNDEDGNLLMQCSVSGTIDISEGKKPEEFYEEIRARRDNMSSPGDKLYED